MAQSHKMTMMEVASGTFVGFIGSWIITYFTLTYVHDRIIAPTVTVCLCTVWSLVRGYFVRRHFNRIN